jgi:threonine synthase
MTVTPEGGRRPYTIRCSSCGTPDTYPAYRCTLDGAPLVVDAAPLGSGTRLTEPGVPGVWRHRMVLPETTHAVTLGEGDTPLLASELQPAANPDARILLKLESLNPSLSFKDRAMALGSSVALDLGLEGLLLASTGNAAVSAAAYAARAGLACRVVCGSGTGASRKLEIAREHGADVVVVEGDYSTAYETATAGERDGWLNVTTTHRNPLLAEAYRGLAIELFEQLGGAPAAVVVPIGAGPLAVGVWRGFTDLLTTGQLTRAELPRVVGVQAAACAPLARAWGEADPLGSLTAPFVAGPTTAGAIADALRGYEREGLLTLDAISASGGTVVAVDEVAIAAAVRSLARTGVSVEPAAATALAAVETHRLTEDGGSVVLLMTGHGAKEAGQ